MNRKGHNNKRKASIEFRINLLCHHITPNENKGESDCKEISADRGIRSFGDLFRLRHLVLLRHKCWLKFGVLETV